MELRQYLGLVRSDLVGLLRTPITWVIIGLCMTMLVFALSEVAYMFGNYAWPVSYNVIDLIRSVSLVIMVVIITFYSGELVWRDRETNVDGITSAIPVRLRTLVLAKYTVLLLIGLGLLVLMGLAGMGRQLISGYTHLQPGLYLFYLLMPGLIAFAFWSAIALAIQLVVNNKYMGFGLFIVLFAVNSMIWGFLKVSSNLVLLFGAPRMMYSDLNGFGPFLAPWLFFRTYWLAFAACLLFIAALSAVRGGEDSWKWRMRKAGVRWKRSWRIGAVAFCGWCTFLAFGYYNTRVLNTPITEQDSEALQVAYEQTYKRYRNTPLPHFTAVDITVELDPEERAIRYTACLTLTNKGSAPVDTLWFSLPDRMRMTFSVPHALEVLNDSARFQRMFRLNSALLPGDSIRVVVNGEWAPKGFANDVEFLSLVENGTFLNTQDLLPMIGYQAEVEMEDPGARRKFGLPMKRRMALLSDDPRDRASNETMEHADRIRFACTIGTATDQIGIAPGTLVKDWEANGKRWFRYESETPIFNFWSVLSARYAVSREQAGDVTLEVYHHPEHGTNVPRMLKSMRDAIAYASENFGQYQHKVARIIEFPRYRRFAQSFPATMPYSEAIGFITDLRDTSRIDMVYYVVAHEVAHQWWGHQVLGPRMQGSTMMVESMAQYTALMVLEKEYGRSAMRKFLKYERDNYLRGRGQEGMGEMPLMKVENQQYIHYNKGSVLMYGLRDFIGEARVNSAYRAFVDSFAFKGAPYPTTLDLYRSLELVTPDSLHYLLEDGMKHITFCRNAVTEAKVEANADGSWNVMATITGTKLHADSLGKEAEVPMNDWLDVAVELEGGGEMKQRLRLRSGVNTVRLVVARKPKAVVVDPDHLFFDREGEDDRKKVE
ncbi:MAG: ABC transporter permease [Flavobacteriales bacterium]|nr:ABC transporter permease [Flavobacteriales bacterium]